MMFRTQESFVMPDITPACPICGQQTKYLWIRRLPEAPEWEGVFLCKRCRLKWRMSDSRQGEQAVPICPVCEMPTDMTSLRGWKTTWICPEDGTMLNGVGCHASITGLEERAALACS